GKNPSGNVGQIGVIDQVIQGGVFVDARTDGAVKRLVRLIIPHFCGRSGSQVDAIFARRTVGPIRPRRDVIETASAIIKKQKVIIPGERNRMLADWRKSGWGAKRKSVLTERRKLVPLFGGITENPFYRSRVVIKGYDKILTARHD